MRSLKLDEDIRPLSEFRAGVATFIKQVNETGRPLVLTQHGRGVAVVIDIAEYAEMRERFEIMEDIAAARAEIAAGEGIPHEDAMRLILDGIPGHR